ncbi:MAG: hypothetical protein GF353_26205 [Candidatus Lokiarchaeota archaeon]|nr:hypothetical protein [Candidatus Lokiarchaeota archaeon]
MKSNLFAVRAINQYRRRDIVAYIGLRYYLENSCARSNHWARKIATHLVKTRSAPVYFCSYHFKELNECGSVSHRKIFTPGPNEILAESVLLYECSLYPAFRSHQCVYSYQFPKTDSNEGIFKYYFPGYQKRHKSIAAVCNSMNDAFVQFTDIKKFYPSISKELGLRAWHSASELSSIPPIFRDMGEFLLADHEKIAKNHDGGLGLLTGPMFSHLIANLVLAKVDKVMYKKMDGRYWRYVDDIVLVGNDKQIKDGRKLLNHLLCGNGLEFCLHTEGKTFRIKSSEWLKGENDFDNSESKAWANLVVNIKRFLLVNFDQRIDLQHAFADEVINMPLLDYSSAVEESSYLEKFSDWLGKYPWAPKSVRALTVNELVEKAIKTREFYQNKINHLLDRNSNIKGYERKRMLSKIRFYAGRLIYLSAPDFLFNLSLGLRYYPELLLWSKVMEAIYSRDVSDLLRFGNNAVQAAAQILCLKNDSVECSLDNFDEIELQGLAILRINGIKIFFTNNIVDKTITDSLNKFALGDNQLELMKSDDPFIKEIACLRGVEKPLRHKTMLFTAFDRDEHLSFDILNRLRESSYF